MGCATYHLSIYIYILIRIKIFLPALSPSYFLYILMRIKIFLSALSPPYWLYHLIRIHIDSLRSQVVMLVFRSNPALR